MSTSVRHDRERRRFVADLEGPEAHLEYVLLAGGQLDFRHTFVPPEQRGKGVAEDLVRAGLGYAQEEGLRVVPSCPYVARFIERHPEFAGLVD